MGVCFSECILCKSVLTEEAAKVLAGNILIIKLDYKVNIWIKGRRELRFIEYHYLLHRTIWDNFLPVMEK